MSPTASAKANLTKARKALQTSQGKISPQLFDPIAPTMHQHQLIARRDELVARLEDLRAAIAAVVQRRTEFLATSLDSDQSSHETYLQEHSIDDVVIEAESIAAKVQAHLDEVNSLIQAPSATDTSQLMPQVPAHEEQLHEASVNTSPAHACDPQLVSNFSPQTFACSSPGTVPALVQSTNNNMYPPQVPHVSPIHLDRLVLEPFYGDVTQFHKFWCSFELAVHNDPNIHPVHKFLYLQGLLKGDAQIVLQDLDPERPNYNQLVSLLQKRYNRPHKIRATLHKQLQQIPQSRSSGSDLRNTWFRISGILHGLRKYKDFKTVLPLLDLVKSKFPLDIRQKLHDLEFQTGADFDLDQIIVQLDLIISSCEKYEDSCILGDSLAIQTSHKRSPSGARSPSHSGSDPERCSFCDSHSHVTYRCRLSIPPVVRRKLVKAHGLCWKCLRGGHSTRSCNYPVCRRCGSSHHEMLCDDTSRSSPSRSSPSRHTSRQHEGHRSRRDDYRTRHRSPRSDYPSRSPSPYGHRHHYGYSSRSGRSRSHSPDGSRLDRSPQYRSSRRSPSSTRSVSFSPVREHRTSSMRRRNSPHLHDRRSSPYDHDPRHVHFREATYSTQHSSSTSSLMFVKTKAADSDLQRFEDVVLLLDSGAQRSFISNATTKSLHLQAVNAVPRTFVTFGGNSVTELSGTVHVHLIDANGQFVALKLLNKDVITLAQAPPRLTKQDIDFIHAQGLQLPTIQEDLVTPNILIGMDHYWDILSSEPPVCLPSGMLAVVAAGCSNPHPLRASAQDRTAQ
ncbi:unnamed protein product [Nippostrongylus brasiliensis]|uniref:CCHC-type domain-containing protein n=1 Tax=Nippostrongylus brasiliensis TaxID=27835 RepID=A0A0N4YN63_NIPBR|nr:unnamed protein product [Nippostrongylus brasiliensis]